MLIQKMNFKNYNLYKIKSLKSNSFKVENNLKTFEDLKQPWVTF